MPTETVTWHPASERPDSDTTVLLWIDEFACGWWDDADGVWRGCVDGCVLYGVTHWAMPEGPQC